jgi:hypothetical protein
MPALDRQNDRSDWANVIKWGDRVKKLSNLSMLGGLALVAGAAIAWVDSRPNWDDTGITVGALFLCSGFAAFLGLRWWVSAVLVACPLILVEFRSAGWGLLVALALTGGGSMLGALLHRLCCQPHVQ